MLRHDCPRDPPPAPKTSGSAARQGRALVRRPRGTAGRCRSISSSTTCSTTDPPLRAARQAPTATTACVSPCSAAARFSSATTSIGGPTWSTPTTGRRRWFPVYLNTTGRSEGPLAPCGERAHDPQPGLPGLVPCAETETLDLGRDLYHLGLEAYDAINLLKGGIHHATLVTTVSPTYAQEIQTPWYGEGLDGVLRSRRGDLFGVLNGIDYQMWDPATDPLIPRHSSADGSVGQALLQGGAAARGRAAPAPGGAAGGHGHPALETEGSRRGGRRPGSTARPGPAARPSGHRRSMGHGVLRQASEAPSPAVPRLDHLRREAGPPDRGWSGLLPDAVPLGALRPQPDVQHALRHPADRSGHRRAARHRREFRRGQRRGHLLQVPRPDPRRPGGRGGLGHGRLPQNKLAHERLDPARDGAGLLLGEDRRRPTSTSTGSRRCAAEGSWGPHGPRPGELWGLAAAGLPGRDQAEPQR